MKTCSLSLALVVVTACSSSPEGKADSGTSVDVVETGDEGGTDPGTDEATLGQPPLAGPAKSPDGTGSVTFAITRLFLGDRDRSGAPDFQNGWKAYGYNLDHRVTTAESTDVCIPRDGNPLKNLVDGNDGIDNSYGRNILPISLALTPDVTERINDAIQQGKPTTLFELESLGSGDSYNPISARAYVGADLGAAPELDGTDVWPVAAESLSDPGDLTSSKMSFPHGYVVDDTWVSGTGELTIVLTSDTGVQKLRLHHAIVTMTLDENHQNGTHGTIAGVLDTDEFIADYAELAQQIDPSFCTTPNPVLDSITAQLGQASDILADGGQDPARTCDGISVGFGFEASAVQLGDVRPAEPPVDPCAP